jgi:hypothetical protein
MSNTPPVPQPPPPQPPPQTAKPTDPKEGRYKARAAAPDPTGAPHEFGRSTNQTPELLVHLFFPELQRTFVTPLYFSVSAAPFSEERLRALGCTDLSTLAGIDSNEVDAEIRYDWYDGAWKMKVQILSGGGVFHTSNPMGGKDFAANVQAMLGRKPNLGGESGGSSSSSNGGSAPKPPF